MQKDLLVSAGDAGWLINDLLMPMASKAVVILAGEGRHSTQCLQVFVFLMPQGFFVEGMGTLKYHSPLYFFVK